VSASPPPEDLALVEEFVEAFNRGDLDRCLSLTPPEFTMDTAREWPGGGSYSGHAQVRAFLEEFIGDWERIRYEHSDPEIVNRGIVERARWVGAGRTSGIESSVDFYAVWSVADGQITRFAAFALKEEARGFARGS
jgi:ketosteroid isomerase-like protein